MATPPSKDKEPEEPEEPEVTKYLLSKGGGESGGFVIEVPTDWKITFSSVNPASQGRGYNNGYCVRVYEMPGSKLRAVFDGVASVRDLAIPLLRKVSSETGSATWTKDSVGNFKRTEERKVSEKLELDMAIDASALGSQEGLEEEGF